MGSEVESWWMLEANRPGCSNYSVELSMLSTGHSVNDDERCRYLHNLGGNAETISSLLVMVTNRDFLLSRRNYCDNY